ncbi:hypothetical protein Tco_1485083 [Tanacetum coccineum]
MWMYSLMIFQDSRLQEAWIYEWNKDVSWVANMPWLDYGPWMEPSDDTEHICNLFCFKNGHVKWPTCNWKRKNIAMEEIFRGVIQIGDEIYFESYEWYKNLEYDELKDEALRCKAMLEESMNVEEESSDEARNLRSPIDELEDFERANHVEADVDSNYNPYLDVSRIFNNHA